MVQRTEGEKQKYYNGQGTELDFLSYSSEGSTNTFQIHFKKKAKDWCSRLRCVIISKNNIIKFSELHLC